jgi:Protein of unknown function (DUF1572)
MADELREALKHAVCDELAAALGRIAHCVGQLSDQQVWARSKPGMNSIGNLMLHLAGNVQQLIVSGLGGVPDDRDRPAEFAAREPISSDELLGKLLLTVKRAQETFRTVTTEDLCGPLKLTKYDLTGLQAAIRCIAHFRGHTQEIIHMTRELLGDKYEFAGPH